MGGRTALAADEKALRSLHAPAPAEVRQLPGGAQSVRFARVVVQLPPEPWALVEVGAHREGNAVLYPDKRLFTWGGGQQEVKTSAVSTIFEEEVRAAGGRSKGDDDSLFSDESAADLLVAVRVFDMNARLCQYCEYIYAKPAWHGVVTMSARWEVYSPLDRKVIAAVETHGGYTAPKDGVDGDSERLINEAFRDNIRRLIASDEFRRVITSATPRPAGTFIALPNATPISFAPSRAGGPLTHASASVAIIYASDGQGSGFLIGREGYLLTNHHVVGGSKYVKVKWPGGAETFGEVVRSDRKRDVALVKADPQGRNPLAIRSGDAHQGETVFAIGTPLDDALQNTMTKGIVSATRTMDGLPFIQSDTAITHGNSGGPLLDEKGQVVGIAVSVIEPQGSQIGLNFFIPIDDALRALALTPVAEPTVEPPAPGRVAAAPKPGKRAHPIR